MGRRQKEAPGWTFTLKFTVSRTGRGSEAQIHKAELLKVFKARSLTPVLTALLILALVPLGMYLMVQTQKPGHIIGEHPAYDRMGFDMQHEAAAFKPEPVEEEETPVITPLNAMDPTSLVMSPGR